MLQQESLGLTQIDAVTCRVIEGDWYSAYDGLTLLYAADVDIDHVVALKEAWDSGAWQWSGPARIAYANDLTDGRTLLAVSSDSNVAKSDKDPSNWLPSNCSAWPSPTTARTRGSSSSDSTLRILLSGFESFRKASKCQRLKACLDLQGAWSGILATKPSTTST